MSDSAPLDSTLEKRREYHRLYYHRMKPEQRRRKLEREKQWAAENPDKVKAASDRFRAKIRAVIDEAKNVPCVDCGGRFAACAMDFHHHNGGKELDISRSMSISLKRLKAEIAKCVVLCANCHRIRHYEQ